MIVSYLGLVFLVVTDVTKQKKYPHSSNANTIFTIRLITNVNVNTYSASWKLHYTGIWTKRNI